METTLTATHGTAQELTGVPSASVDLIVTSPPYPMVAMWDGSFRQQDPRIGDRLDRARGAEAFELMHALLDAAWRECGRVLRPGGLACINIGDATRTLAGDFQLYTNHSRILHSFLDLGFAALPDILWRKQTNAPDKFLGSGMLPVGAYVTYEHEYILILRKGPRRCFATAAEQRRRRESAFFWEERNVWFSDVWQDIKGAAQDLPAAAPGPDRGSRIVAERAPELWDPVPVEADRAAAGESAHPARARPAGAATSSGRRARQAGESAAGRERSGAFPFDLAYRLICMFSVHGDMVLDPFAGTGTTLAAALASGRSALGVEREPALAGTAHRLLAAAPANAYIRDRLARHLAFVSRRTAEVGPLKYANVHYGFPVMTRQERELLLPEVRRVTVAGDGVVRVAYDSAPRPVSTGA